MTEDLIARGGRMLDRRLMSLAEEQKEFKALESAVVVPLLAHTPLRVTGEDRLDFVHGQLSNEVKRLKQGQFSENLMLNHKGHALAQMQVFRREDDLFIVVEGRAGAFVEGQLRAHIVFDQVALQNLSGMITTLSVQGQDAEKIVLSLTQDLPATKTFIQIPFASAKILIHPSRRSAPGGFDLHVLTKDAHHLLEHVLGSGAVLAGEIALTMSRIEAGIPYAETEGGEGVLPQECGLESWVSYTKGCYLGQEIMARIEARGNLRRGLKGLELSGIPAGREIMFADKQVGQLGAVAEHPQLGVIALGVLRHDLDANAGLSVGGLEAKVMALPFSK